MSTTTKKTSPKGVRYTDAQKKEVIDFVKSYNSSNSRGGQSKAAEKFGISQLTVAGWLKAASAPAKTGKAAKAAKAPKAAKPAKAAKAPKAAKAASKGKAGSRYTDEQKKAVTDFVTSYNAQNGRGGASNAAKKFSISPLTVVAWLKAAGAKGSAGKSAKKASKAAPAKASKAANGGFSAKLSSLLALSGQIDKAEAELAKLKATFSELKKSL
jgi:transposase